MKNRLSHIEYLAVADYLRSMAGTEMAIDHNAKELAEHVQMVIETPLANHTVSKIARDLGIRLKGNKWANGSGEKDIDQLDRIEKKLNRLLREMGVDL